ncbi:hypothetical protein DTO212C5_4584 [Paecilomyces variotii]|nr:hypothetical protein DTO212C5_4584 [Paecilomyces variotii]
MVNPFIWRPGPIMIDRLTEKLRDTMRLGASIGPHSDSENCGTHQLLAVHVVRPYLPLSFRAGQWQGTGRQWPRRAERNGFEEMRIQSLDA